jgi:hypothetical protein
MIYRVHLTDSADGSAGFMFTTRQDAQVEALPTPKTQQAWFALLKYVGSHPDNG